MIAAEYCSRAPCRAAMRPPTEDGECATRVAAMGWAGPRLAASSGARCAGSPLTFDWWWILGEDAGDDARLLIKWTHARARFVDSPHGGVCFGCGQAPAVRPLS